MGAREVRRRRLAGYSPERVPRPLTCEDNDV